MTKALSVRRSLEKRCPACGRPFICRRQVRQVSLRASGSSLSCPLSFAPFPSLGLGLLRAQEVFASRPRICRGPFSGLGRLVFGRFAWQAACQGRPRHSKRQPGTGPVMPLAGRSAPPLGLYFWFSLRSSSVGPRVSSGVVKEPLGPTEEELRVGRDKYAALKRRPAAVVVSTTGVYLRAGRLTGPAIHGG